MEIYSFNDKPISKKDAQQIVRNVINTFLDEYFDGKASGDDFGGYSEELLIAYENKVKEIE